MNQDGYKIVKFDEYCKQCKHWKKKSTEEPCDECQCYPANLYSHKPVKFEEK